MSYPWIWLAAIVCLVGCSGTNQPRPLSKTATLELYVVAAMPTTKTKQTIDPATGAPLYLMMPAIISAADVATIQRSDDSQSTSSLAVNLTPAGAKKLAVATAAPAGMRIAFVVNGRVVSTPKLQTQISNAFVITGNDDLQSREHIYAALTRE